MIEGAIRKHMDAMLGLRAADHNSPRAIMTAENVCQIANDGIRSIGFMTRETYRIPNFQGTRLSIRSRRTNLEMRLGKHSRLLRISYTYNWHKP